MCNKDTKYKIYVGKDFDDAELLFETWNADFLLKSPLIFNYMDKSYIVRGKEYKFTPTSKNNLQAVATSKILVEEV